MRFVLRAFIFMFRLLLALVASRLDSVFTRSYGSRRFKTRTSRISLSDICFSRLFVFGLFRLLASGLGSVFNYSHLLRDIVEQNVPRVFARNVSRFVLNRLFSFRLRLEFMASGLAYFLNYSRI